MTVSRSSSTSNSIFHTGAASVPIATRSRALYSTARSSPFSLSLSRAEQHLYTPRLTFFFPPRALSSEIFSYAHFSPALFACLRTLARSLTLLLARTCARLFPFEHFLLEPHSGARRCVCVCVYSVVTARARVVLAKRASAKRVARVRPL